jgi:signal transduction histidine kinase
MWKTILTYIFPDDEKKDPRFKEELDRLSLFGLRIIAGVDIAAPLFSIVVGLAFVPEMQQHFRIAGPVGIFVLGIVTLGLSFWAPVKPFARWLGILNGFFVFVALVYAQADAAEPIFALAGNVTTILLVGIACLPLQPFHALTLGLSMGAFHLAVTSPMGLATVDSARLPMFVVSLAQTVLMGCALTAVVYHQRVRGYRARRAAQDAFEELKQAQSRLLITQNAASQGRLAAALSHELNSPIGALSSAIETLVSATNKLENELQEAARLKDVIAGASDSARQSTERLMRIVDRMKQLTNLDRAEEQMVDLNELWSSSVNLLQAELDPKANVLLELKPLPRVKCKPQQMSAVFANLLRNSADSMDRRGTIQITSDLRGSEVVLEVRDDGKGIAPERLSRLFDPMFRVEGQRVSTTNWGLFISRSIIAEHEGQIEIESTESQGTTARILLPIEATDD